MYNNSIKLILIFFLKGCVKRYFALQAAAVETGEANTHQTLVTVATCDVSFTRAVAANLITRGVEHDDTTGVAVTRWPENTHIVKRLLLMIPRIMDE